MDEFANKPGSVEEDVNIRIWRFAAVEDSSGLHEEESSAGKPITGPETRNERPTLDYERSAGLPSLPGCMIGDSNNVCFWPPSSWLALDPPRRESHGLGREAEC